MTPCNLCEPQKIEQLFELNATKSRAEYAIKTDKTTPLPKSNLVEQTKQKADKTRLGDLNFGHLGRAKTCEFRSDFKDFHNTANAYFSLQKCQSTPDSEAKKCNICLYWKQKHQWTNDFLEPAGDQKQYFLPRPSAKSRGSVTS